MSRFKADTRLQRFNQACANLISTGKHKTYTSIAAAIGVNIQQIYRVKNGKDLPSINLLQKANKGINLNMNYIFNKSNVMFLENKNNEDVNRNKG